MTKAEEGLRRSEKAALEAYPVKMVNGPIGYEESVFDFNALCRYIFQEGYEQAQKDLSLTIEDIENIHTFLYAVKNNKQGVFTFTRLPDEQYKEVLRRFKAIKEEK